MAEASDDQSYVKELMKKAADAKSADDALKFAQAALNCANTIAVLTKTPGAIMAPT